MRRIAGNTPSDAIHTVGPDDDLAEKKARLRQALLSLKPKYQAVITLHFFENMRLTEIAACLGAKPSTVRTRLARATAKLRTKLSAAGHSRGRRP
jgi:RNA polymerase sigma factor (sigma-70 family)